MGVARISLFIDSLASGADIATAEEARLTVAEDN